MKRIIGAAIIILAVALAFLVRSNLREALDIEHDLHTQMNDYAAAANSAGSAVLSNIAKSGNNEMESALLQVKHKQYQYETELAAAAAGLLAGIFLVTRKPQATQRV